MQISSALAGYSLGARRSAPPGDGQEEGRGHGQGEGRLPRRAPRRRRSTPAIAERVFDLMEKFAGYGFNRSHSAAYGLLTYQTAYLKRYFPVEFFAALLTCDKDDTDAIVKFIAEARSQGIPVLRPDVNESDANFTVVRDGGAGRHAGERRPGHGPARASPARRRPPPQGKAIRFGLAAVKGVGEGAVEAIQARAHGGRALPVDDRLLHAGRRPQGEPQGARGAGQVGRLRRHRREERGQTRRAVFGAIGPAMERAAQAQRERESGQTSLLALLAAAQLGRERPSSVDDSLRRRAPTSGCRASCWPTRRRASAFTSAATRSTASPASCAASPPPTRPTHGAGARAPRSPWAAWSATTRSGWPRAARANTPSSSWRTSSARSSSWWATPACRSTATRSPAASRCWSPARSTRPSARGRRCASGCASSRPGRWPRSAPSAAR